MNHLPLFDQRASSSGYSVANFCNRWQNLVYVEVIDPNLRRHQLVQQSAEQVGELLPLHFKKPPLRHDRLQNSADFLLNHNRRHRKEYTFQIALVNA